MSGSVWRPLSVSKEVSLGWKQCSERLFSNANASAESLDVVILAVSRYSIANDAARISRASQCRGIMEPSLSMQAMSAMWAQWSLMGARPEHIELGGRWATKTHLPTAARLWLHPVLICGDPATEKLELSLWDRSTGAVAATKVALSESMCTRT